MKVMIWLFVCKISGEKFFGKNNVLKFSGFIFVIVLLIVNVVLFCLFVILFVLILIFVSVWFFFLKVLVGFVYFIFLNKFVINIVIFLFILSNFLIDLCINVL